MHYFFVTPDQVRDGCCLITGQDVNHIRNVLRMRPGEQVGIRDGISRNYICTLEKIGEEEILARIVSEEEGGSELPARLWLFQGLPKGDKMDWIIQKAVELGVCGIVPMATRRSVVRLDQKKAEAKVRRWNAVSESAAKQSGRMIVPKVCQAVSFSQACAMVQKMDVGLIPYELAEDMSRTRRILENLRPGQDVAVFIGPEGGFAEEEIALALEGGLEPVTLGRRILRTETAGLTVLSWMVYLLET